MQAPQRPTLAELYHNIPKKAVISKVVFKTTTNDVLLVKPNYKDGWQLPGGLVDAKEDPLEAAIREVYEEIGLVIDHATLQIVATAHNHTHDSVSLIYEYMPFIDESARITLQEEELSDYQFINPAAAIDLTSDYYRPFWELFSTKSL